MFFGHTSKEVTYGVLLEIGSGSVMAAIISSDAKRPTPTIVWSRREFTVTKGGATPAQSAKNIITTLINVSMLIESEGRQALEEIAPRTQLSSLLITIAAPWSYTVTKTIEYKKEEPFIITKDLVQDLAATAIKKITEELKENETAESLGLTVIARATTHVHANQYPTKNPFNKKATLVQLAHVSAVAQTYLMNALADVQNKLFPKLSAQTYSFMMVFHHITHTQLYPNLAEYCLVDITHNATELGIVRDGVLRFCTHTPVGISTLAEAIGEALNIPTVEALAFMKEPFHTTALEQLTGAQRAKLDHVLAEYQTEITTLFTETGDNLAIPKTVLMHSGHLFEPFLADHIKTASRTATKSAHVVHHITSNIINKRIGEMDKKALLNHTNDTSLLLSALFFHTRATDMEFIRS